VFGLGFGALQDFGVFVGDDQQPGAARLFDLGPFLGVDQPLDGAVDDHLDRFSASITARLPWMAQLVPVDFTGTGAVCGGVGIWIMQNSAPRS
jgi:hypothetical protein